MTVIDSVNCFFCQSLKQVILPLLHNSAPRADFYADFCKDWQKILGAALTFRLG